MSDSLAASFIKVNVGSDQDMAQSKRKHDMALSERNSHTKKRAGKKN